MKRACLPGLALLLAPALHAAEVSPATTNLPPPVFPGRAWATLKPEAVGLDAQRLEAFRQLVGGRGCVVRRGYLVFTWGDTAKSSDVASAFKPLLSTLLLLAVQEGKLSGVDARVAETEPRLATLNDGKDARMTWRHLASQTSGYGLADAPGTAYAYNDFALALYYDTLTRGVFEAPGTEVLRTRLAEPLQFEDACTFEAFGPRNRPGRLAVSVRDFARFGLLWLQRGKWGERQLIRPDLVELALGSAVPAELPVSAGVETPMLPRQRTLGGGKMITPIGPGYYSFNWWLNHTNHAGQRFWIDAPADTFVASGHGGQRALWIIPSLDLVVAWNDSGIDDHDRSPGNAGSRMNRAIRLLVEAAGGKLDSRAPGRDF